MIARYALLEGGIPFESRRMDIHLSREQLQPWYLLINPAMTVPSMVEGKYIWRDSQDILKYAAAQAAERWMDSDPSVALNIEQIVHSHYAIAIERLTMGKAISSSFLLKRILPKVLYKAIRSLEAEKSGSTNPEAIEDKIKLNKGRLAYFTEGDLKEKLQFERTNVRTFLERLPAPKELLFGEKPSSADIVTVALFARLKMIGEYDLVTEPELQAWFERMRARSAYKKADIWTRFQPWRILFRC
jgi:glutathione S-transferase